MARPRQTRKNRSSNPRVKTGTAGRTKAGKKKVNFLGNQTIRENWDRKLTLAQNYEKLGLSVKLKGRAGGVEKQRQTVTNTKNNDSLAIPSGIQTTKLTPTEVEVVRDADGNILEVVDPSSRPRSNPLSDPLNELEEEESDMEVTVDPKASSTNPIVAQLEAQAVAEAEEIARTKKPRTQSAREEEWLERLVAKHGDNYTAMFRDRKLNVMQQSEGDIKRRVKKWKAKHDG